MSRRDPVRALIGFWTSGNRVFSLADPKRVGRLIELCHSDLGAMKFTYARTKDHTRRLGMSTKVYRRLFDILLVELQKHTATERAA